MTQREAFAGQDRLRYGRRDAAAGAAATGILIAAPALASMRKSIAPSGSRYMCAALVRVGNGRSQSHAEGGMNERQQE